MMDWSFVTAFFPTGLHCEILWDAAISGRNQKSVSCPAKVRLDGVHTYMTSVCARTFDSFRSRSNKNNNSLAIHKNSHTFFPSTYSSFFCTLLIIPIPTLFLSLFHRSYIHTYIHTTSQPTNLLLLFVVVVVLKRPIFVQFFV